MILLSHHNLFDLCQVIPLFLTYAAYAVTSPVFPSMPVSLKVGSLGWVPVFVFSALDFVSWHWSHDPHLCLYIFELRGRNKSNLGPSLPRACFDPKLGPCRSWHTFMTTQMASKTETKLLPSIWRTISPTSFSSLTWFWKSWKRFSDGEIFELEMILIIPVTISWLRGKVGHMFEFDTCWDLELGLRSVSPTTQTSDQHQAKSQHMDSCLLTETEPSELLCWEDSVHWLHWARR